MNFKYISILLLLFMSFSCTSQNSQNLIDISVGLEKIKVEIVATDESRALGLMNRESLDENHGMIFVFDHERSVSFWMKNTLIPLSIAYINKKGQIMEIYDMKALSLEPVPSKRSSVLYALEVNRGCFENRGIVIGDSIDLQPILDYLKSSK